MCIRDRAKSIGKPYSTLLREVNPYDTGAKLGAETLLQIMTQTGDLKPLEFMASSLGYEPVSYTHLIKSAAGRGSAQAVRFAQLRGGCSDNVHPHAGR